MFDIFPIVSLACSSRSGLFLMDGGCGVWLWQDWWPDKSTESAALRFNFARRAALKTTISFCATNGVVAYSRACWINNFSNF